MMRLLLLLPVVSWMLLLCGGIDAAQQAAAAATKTRRDLCAALNGTAPVASQSSTATATKPRSLPSLEDVNELLVFATSADAVDAGDTVRMVLTTNTDGSTWDAARVGFFPQQGSGDGGGGYYSKLIQHGIECSTGQLAFSYTDLLQITLVIQKSIQIQAVLYRQYEAVAMSTYNVTVVKNSDETYTGAVLPLEDNEEATVPSPVPTSILIDAALIIAPSAETNDATPPTPTPLQFTMLQLPNDITSLPTSDGLHVQLIATVSTPTDAPVVATTSTTATTTTSTTTVCLLCKEPGLEVANRKAVLQSVHGDLTCGSLQDEKERGLSADECGALQDLVLGTCGCAKGGAANGPSRSPEVVESVAAVVPMTAPSMRPALQSVAIPSLATDGASSSKGATLAPTYSEYCLFCPLVNETANFTVQGTVYTCEAFVSDAANGLVTPDLCEAAAPAVNETCGCAASVHAEILLESPVPAPVRTLSPTITMYPTVTDSPTHSTYCQFCDLVNEDATATILGMMYSCKEFVKDAAAGLFSPELCKAAAPFIEHDCGCASLALSPVRTLQPTVTAYPTVTSSPTYSTYCDFCEIADATASVNILGMMYNCQAFVQDAASATLSPELCKAAAPAIAQECGCVPTAAPVRTLEPTVTAYPTITDSPTYSSTCSLHCSVSNESTTVNILGLIYNCKAFMEEAAKGLFSPALCQEAAPAVERDCGCVPAAGPVTTFAPSASAYPTITSPPSYNGPKCNLCVEDTRATIVFSNKAYTCGELLRFASKGLIPPDMCADAASLAQQTCGCGNSTQIPQVAPVDGSDPQSSQSIRGSQLSSTRTCKLRYTGVLSAVLLLLLI
jgi:hypothetical protein